MDWQWLLALGLGTGAFGVMVGTGGGLILVPMLLLLFDMEPALVAGTSLALVAVNSFSGTVAYHRLGLVDRRSGLLFAGAAIPGSLVAPFAVAAVAGDTFRLLFGIILVSLALHMALRTRIAGGAAESSKPTVPAMLTSRRITTGKGQVFQYQFNEALAVGFNVVLGFISAFFGTGGGFLRTPILVAAFSFPLRVAVATSVFALSIYATTGAVVHAALGHVDWYPTFVWAGIGLMVGSQIGARLAATVQTFWILRALVLLLLVMGARLLAEGLVG